MNTIAPLRAKGPAPGLSARYEFVDSNLVVAAAQEAGWHLHAAQHVRPLHGGEHAGHMLDLRNKDLPAVRDTVPRLIVTNSHDGSRALRLSAGAFRFVCANGLVVGQTIASARIQHKGTDLADRVLDAIRAMAQETTRTYTQIERWAKKDLTAPQRREFARFAAMLRWNSAGFYEPDELLAVRRAADDAGDLWTTFNRVQENTVRGGLTGRNANGHAATSKPLLGIHTALRYNAELWNLAAEVADCW